MADVAVDSRALESVAAALSGWVTSMGGGELSEDPGVGYPANRAQLTVIAGEALARFERWRAVLISQLTDLHGRAVAVAAEFPALDVELAREA